MKNEMMKSLEVSNLFGLKDKETKKVLRKSKRPTIHRDKNGDKSLIERDFINNLYNLISQIFELYDGKNKVTKKQKKNFYSNMFMDFLLSNNDKAEDYGTIVKGIHFIDESLDVTVVINNSFRDFTLIDKKLNTYYFGCKKDVIKTSNNRNYTPHTKSPHIVKKHYRNQPYGSRNNPQYKRIKIKSFVKGGKKVG